MFINLFNKYYYIKEETIGVIVFLVIVISVEYWRYKKKTDIVE